MSKEFWIGLGVSILSGVASVVVNLLEKHMTPIIRTGTLTLCGVGFLVGVVMIVMGVFSSDPNGEKLASTTTQSSTGPSSPNMNVSGSGNTTNQTTINNHPGDNTARRFRLEDKAEFMKVCREQGPYSIILHHAPSDEAEDFARELQSMFKLCGWEVPESYQTKIVNYTPRGIVIGVSSHSATPLGATMLHDTLKRSEIETRLIPIDEPSVTENAFVVSVWRKS